MDFNIKIISQKQNQISTISQQHFDTFYLQFQLYIIYCTLYIQFYFLIIHIIYALQKAIFQ